MHCVGWLVMRISSICIHSDMRFGPVYALLLHKFLKMLLHAIFIEQIACSQIVTQRGEKCVLCRYQALPGLTMTLHLLIAQLGYKSLCQVCRTDNLDTTRAHQL